MVLDRVRRGPSYTLHPLTITDGVITDRTRGLADQGDGVAPSDQSDGVWAAATNLITNSNAKTNTTGVVDNGSTTTRETTGLVGADTTRFKHVTNNAADLERSFFDLAGASSTQYTLSIWLSGSGSIKLFIYDSVANFQVGGVITLTATPTKYSLTATTGAASAGWAAGWRTSGQLLATVYSARWMCETGAVATPHVLTDGATAVSVAGRIQVPNIRQYLSETQGAVAVLMRYGYDTATQYAAGYPASIDWANASIHGIRAYRNPLGGASAVFGNTDWETYFGPGNGAKLKGELEVTLLSWGGGRIGAAYDGGAVSDDAYTPPTGFNTYLSLLSLPGQEANSYLLAAAFWPHGNLSNADSAAINAIVRAKRGALRPRDLPGDCSGVIIGSSGVVIGR